MGMKNENKNLRGKNPKGLEVSAKISRPESSETETKTKTLRSETETETKTSKKWS